MSAIQLVAILGFGFIALGLAVSMAIYLLKVSEHTE